MTTKKSGPSINRHRSVQDVATPRAFLDAVERRFGRISVDAAASADNRVVDTWMGPGSPWPDALTVPWGAIDGRSSGGLFWLNPPFSLAPKFAAKAAEEGAKGVRVAMLIPASVSTAWFAAHVYGKALVLPIRPRLTFVGSTAPYPKDLILAIYGPFAAPGFACWRWDGKEDR